MTRGKKSQFHIIHFFFSVLFLGLVGGGAWYIAKTYKPRAKEYYLSQAQVYTEGLMGGLGVNPELKESKKWKWIDEDGSQVPLIGYQFLLGTSENNAIGKYGNAGPKHLEKIDAHFFAPLFDDIDTFFTQSHFVTNTKNQHVPKYEHFLLRAYERNKVKCIIKLTYQADPFGTIFCGIYSNQ